MNHLVRGLSERACTRKFMERRFHERTDLLLKGETPFLGNWRVTADPWRANKDLFAFFKDYGKKEKRKTKTVDPVICIET